MLRIHFTSQDLERIRIADRPDPLWEIICSACRLQSREGPQVFGLWRRGVGSQLRRGGTLLRTARMLCGLVPVSAYFPDFLTPAGERRSLSLEEGVDRVLSTPRRRIGREMGLLAASGGNPYAGRALAGGEREALHLLGAALREYHASCIVPVGRAMETAVRADVEWRSRALREGGIEGLWATFRPMATWRSPALEAGYPVDRDLHLDGRGLLLMPSYFCWRRPVTLVDASLQPVLVYPVERPLPAVSAACPAELSGLIGSTRAALLQEAAAHAWNSTSEMAAAAGISLPSASQQLAVLRRTGLLTSRRDGKHVLHSATPLGRRLLGDPPG
ncbi:ArsR/SmtB family transcription factor [Streptomyces sp. NPDC004134]|uniref:ArsR/SmtB family transcription factor n=1 Tax=Streptomyces sp. NPDC004134 TaxID=3364691 RepID=UPI003694A07B